MPIRNKERIDSSSKFFEIFNLLVQDQLAELTLFFESFGDKLNIGQKERFFALLNERKNGRILDEQWIRINIWKTVEKEWNKDKTAFQRIVDRFLLADLRYRNFWGDYALLRYYRDHNLEKNFNLLWKKCAKNLKKRSSKNSLLEMQLFLLHELKTNRNKSDRSTKTKDFLLLSEQNLDSFYALQKLRMACEQLNRKKVINKGDHSKSDAKIIKLLCNKLPDFPAIQLYFNIYQFLNQPGEIGFYQTASSLIPADKNALPAEITKEATELLMNYCIRKVAQQQLEFVDEYRYHIEFLENCKLLLDNGFLSLHHFNNYVSICLIQGDLIKVPKIIKKYTGKITPKTEGNQAIMLSNLRYHLFNLQTEKCWELINSIHTSDKAYNFLLDKIYLKLFFLDKDQTAFHTKLLTIRRKLDKEKILKKTDQTNIRNLMIVLNAVITKKKTVKEINLENYQTKLSPLDYAWLKKAFEKK